MQYIFMSSRDTVGFPAPCSGLSGLVSQSSAAQGLHSNHNVFHTEQGLVIFRSRLHCVVKVAMRYAWPSFVKVHTRLIDLRSDVLRRFSLSVCLMLLTC